MRFRGKLKTIQKDFLSNNYIVSFEMEEGRSYRWGVLQC